MPAYTSYIVGHIFPHIGYIGQKGDFFEGNPVGLEIMPSFTSVNIVFVFNR